MRALRQTSTKTPLECPSLELREFNCDLNTSLSPAIFTWCYPPSKCLLTGVNYNLYFKGGTKASKVNSRGKSVKTDISSVETGFTFTNSLAKTSIKVFRKSL